MIDYNLSKIYKITSDNTDEIFIGSTSRRLLSQSLSTHMRQYKMNPRNKAINLVLEKKDCKIILIENFPCKSKYELKQREKYFIDQLDCINKHPQFQPVSPDDARKISAKKYRMKYRDKINEKNRKYYEDNKEHIREISNNSYHKLKLNRKVPCPNCGKLLTKNHLQSHNKMHLPVILPLNPFKIIEQSRAGA